MQKTKFWCPGLTRRDERCTYGRNRNSRAWRTADSIEEIGSYSVAEIDGLLSAEKIIYLYTLQEIEYLFSVSDSNSSLLSCNEMNDLYTVIESDIYSTIALQEQ